MATRYISTKVAIEGEAQYQSSVANINRELKVLQSALKLTESEFKGQANSVAALTAKGEALNNLYEAQRKKVDECKSAMQNAQKAVDDYKGKIERLKAQIEENKKSLEQMNDANRKAGQEWAAQKKIVTEDEAELKKLQRSANDTSEAQAELKAKIEAANAKMAELEEKTGGAAKAAGELIIENEKLNNELADNEAKLDAAKRSTDAWQIKVNDATVELNKLDSEIKKNKGYLDEAEKSADKCAKSIDEFGKEAKEAGSEAGELSQALTAAGITAALKKIAEELKACVEESIEFESAMAGVAKTTDLTTDELTAMGESIKQMSTEIPLAATELAGIAEVAGQLGIAKDSLLPFTEVMANLGVATNLTSEEAATMLAQFTAVTGMDTSFFSNLGSVIVALGNSFATNERRIVDMAQNIAAAGTNAGLTESQMLALSAAVTSVGIETAAGGTSMSKLINQMKTAVETGDDLDKWAKACGLSTKELSQLWAQDASSALLTFIRNLNHLDQSAVVVLKDLGITESRMVTMITSLANAEDKTGLLTNSINTANAAWRENTALVTEASLRYGTTESRLQLMENSFSNLRIAIGDKMTPVLGAFYDGVAKIVNGIADLINKFEGVTPLIAAIIVGLISFIAALSTLALTIKFVIPLIVSFKALIGATLANPVLLAVAGVAALGGAIATLGLAIPKTRNELLDLSSASQLQYAEIQQLRAEHERLVATGQAESEVAQDLKARIEAQTAAYEASKTTMAEVRTAHAQFVESSKQVIAAYNDSESKIKSNASVNTNLLKRLQELTSQSTKTAAAHQEILGIVDVLNQRIPSLGLSYNRYTGELNLSTKAIKAAIEAENKRFENNERIERRMELIEQEIKAEEALAKAKAEVEAAQQRYNDVQERHNEAVGNAIPGSLAYTASIGTLGVELENATLNLEESKARLEESQTAYDEITSSLDELNKTMAGVSDESRSMAEVGTEVAQALSLELNALALAYQQAYDAALKSIEGQFELWDMAEVKADISTKTLREALQSQKEYWSDYHANLETVRSYGIEGMEEFLKYFLDGSTESAAVLAALASEGKSAAESIVGDFQGMREAQAPVADAFAQLEINATENLQNIAACYKETVQEITNASNVDFTPFLQAVDTAFSNVGITLETAGKDAAEGLSTGISENAGQVESASAALGQTVVDTVRKVLDSHSPSQVMDEIGQGIPTGMSEGIKAKNPELESTVYSMAQTIVEKTEKAADDAVKRFVEKYEQINGKTRSILENLRITVNSTTAPLPGDMTTVGNSMIDGMISGLNSRSSSLFSTIRGIVNNAISAARSAADSHSPSRKTKKLFEDIDEGMILGAKSKAAQVAAALQGVVDQALDVNINNRIPDIISGIDDTMPAGPVTNHTTYNNGRQFVVEQINVTVKGNPEDSAETARDLGEEITDELERILRYKGWL